MVAQHVDALAISATDERALAGGVGQSEYATGFSVTIFDSGVNVENAPPASASPRTTPERAARGRRLAALDRQTRQSHRGVVIADPGDITLLRERGFEDTIQKEFRP